MTFRQALELSAHVRKGESGSTVVYASTQSTNTLIP
jgi:antirestriction protein ArdC